ncbi:hypothetical protein F5X68DRAFT_214965 [Plectosphaerella plurivora]|uniref:Secreted protein n=1 Tax=Plectosphaerella plurivora TaxID=936078 RepID=A0A9P9A6L4_9PEZI|nr:hypothetical protein F5X68DRAFT_214965 [Plectosphaerella plurivora]
MKRIELFFCVFFAIHGVHLGMGRLRHTRATYAYRGAWLFSCVQPSTYSSPLGRERGCIMHPGPPGWRAEPLALDIIQRLSSTGNVAHLLIVFW